MANEIQIKITERGNGLVDVGERVYSMEENTVYRVTKLVGGIHTGGAGCGNSQYAMAVPVGDPTELTDEEFEELPEVGVQVVDGEE